MSGEIEVSPLRSLDDFLLESARFQVPNLKDAEKWANRVLNNLLYYQTNYFLTAIIVFLLVGILHPVKMVCGMLAFATAFGGFCYVTNAKRSAEKFKKDHPILSLIIILTASYFTVYMMGSVLVFLLGILLPIMVIFIHASMRLRNVKNKLANKMELFGLKKTPMGMILNALGLEQEGGRTWSKLKQLFENTWDYPVSEYESDSKLDDSRWKWSRKRELTVRASVELKAVREYDEEGRMWIRIYQSFKCKFNRD